MLKNEKILITGPGHEQRVGDLTSGVAFPIARELAKYNEVHGLARFTNPADRIRLQAVGVNCIEADLVSDSFSKVPDDFTYVLNFAVAKTDDFENDLAVSAEGPGRLMYHCRKARAWFQCSSGAVYECVNRRPLKETDSLGDNHRNLLPTYSICKIAGEVMARFGARQWNIPTVIARFSVPYGDDGGWPAYHLESILTGSPIPVQPDGPNWFNPIHQDDYIALIPKLLAVATVPAVTTNLGGEPASVEEWCTYIGELIGREPKFAYDAPQYTSAVIPLDLTRMHELVGQAKVKWREGVRRMIERRHPELPLRA